VKITIAYMSAEEQDAAAVMAALLRLLPGVRAHKNESKSPFLHIYLTTKKPGNRGNSKSNT